MSKMIRAFLLTCWAACLLAAPSGCSGGNSGGPDLKQIATDFYEKAQDCGVMSEGRLPGMIQMYEEWPAEYQELEEYNVCYFRCLLAASCAQIESMICTDDETLDDQCDSECAEIFTCDDGEEINALGECDGWEDCADGSDEAGCPVFTCGDGEEIPADYECDGGEDCADGSDEAGCPVFTCGDGEEIPADHECDWDQDCADGSDELGCRYLVFDCGDGVRIPEGYDCNGDEDCADGSDEVGCAESLCP